MIAEATTCGAVLALDVGKRSHWACLLTRAGEVLENGPVANAERDLDALMSRAVFCQLALSRNRIAF